MTSQTVAMQLSAELAVAVAALFAVAVGFAIWRRRSGRASAAKAPSYRGPTSMHFTCAGCSGQFPHTKRTVAAWEKGSRRVFCDACHKKWRNARPPEARSSSLGENAVQRPAVGTFTPTRPAAAHSSDNTGRSGCLGVVLLLLFVPVVLLAVVVNA